MFLSYHFHLNLYIDHEIRDLETNDLRFTIDAQNWTSSPLWSPTTTLYSTCGTDYLIGGYTVLGGVGRDGSGTVVRQHWLKRTYTDLPTHTGIMFSFKFAMIDSWDTNDPIEFEFDSQLFNGWNIWNPLTPLPQICGNPGWNDLVYIQASGTFVHSSSTLTFTIYSSSDETTIDESCGVRDISLSFVTGANSLTNVLYGKASVTIPGVVSPCSNGQYSTTSPPATPACAPCHSDCELCFGSSNSECYKCKPGFSFYGNACSVCTSPCATCNGNTVNECTSCITGYTVTPVNTCVPVSECLFPMELDYYDTVCKSPCPVGEIIDWEGNCQTSCSSPRTRTVAGVLICDFQCTTVQYLSWRGDCLNSCPSYYQTVVYKSRNFCNPKCPLTQFYVVKTKECVDTCPEGLFANTNTLLCQACLVPLCSSCAPLAPQECLVCQQGAIKDYDGTCKSKKFLIIIKLLLLQTPSESLIAPC